MPARVKVGGDFPFLKRLLGLTIHWGVPSLYDSAYRVDGEWVDKGTPWTNDIDEQRQGLLPVIEHARGAVRAPVFEGLPRQCWVVCILHCLMAIGKLLCAVIVKSVVICFVVLFCTAAFAPHYSPDSFGGWGMGQGACGSIGCAPILPSAISGGLVAQENRCAFKPQHSCKH